MDRPRAKTTSIRTMEHLRRWGLADRLRDVAPLPVSWSQAAMFCTSLLGREITRIEGCLGLTPYRCDEYAEAGQQVPQPLVELVLREGVAACPAVTFAVGWSLAELRQDAQHVTVLAVDAEGERREIAADYVLGCDGAGSPTRRAIGVVFEGGTDGRPNFSMVFRSIRLAALVPHAPAIHHWVLNPATPGLVGRMDLHDTWWAMANGVSPEVGNADPIRLIRTLIGDGAGADEVDIELISTDPWTARMLNATTYRVGRVFLVGDAAHLNPPWGGHGFNTAVGDAVNIGWKLAAVLAGWGGPSLLDSYEAERKPIAQQTIDLATLNMSKLSTNFADPLLSADGPYGDACRAAVAADIQTHKYGEFHSLGLVLGYHYGTSPLTVPDGTPEPPQETTAYTPTARPGSRLPHAWLPDGRSLYDLLGQEFTLLVADPSADPSLIVTAFVQIGATLHVVGATDVGLEPAVLAALYGSDLVLIRPDQHVAWRSTTGLFDEAAASRLARGATGH